ncbi:MAG: glutamate racemase [Clostridia bacterium]|nr:glutamate racemase [Clostridia bacterium]
MKNAPVGFLDSGIGGITVLRKAVGVLPFESYRFFSDSLNNPYGDKEDGEIKARCDEIADILINKEGCKALVLACNTASARAAEYLREKYADTPIIAIEPAYKMVHDINPGGFTLVMATRGTLESEKFHRLYYKYNNNKTDLLACVGLADLIEQGREDELKAYLENLLGKYAGKVENVVLGCTHYPLVKDIIAGVLGDVMFFDGADGVARQLKAVLAAKDLLNPSEEKGTIIFTDSSPDEETRKQKEERFFRYLNG